MGRLAGLTTPFSGLLNLSGRGYHRLIGSDKREQMRRRMELAEAVFRHTHDGILVTDADQRIVDVNQAFTDMTGYRREEVLGRKPRILSSGKHDSDFYRRLHTTVTEQGCWTGDIWNRRKDGSQLIENATISAIHDERGRVVNYVGVFRDITQRRLNQARLERMASYDTLTGLLNRGYFKSLLERHIESLELTQTGLAVLFLDLDDFKPINDRFGHACGDELLVEISRRLKRLMRANDLTARFGGDEFVVALLGLGTAAKAGKVAQKVLTDVIEPLQLDNGERVTVSASIGIAFADDHRVTADALLESADAAMYEAKRLGKNRIAQARPPSEMELRLDSYAVIKSAFEQDQIELFFQPVLALDADEIVGFEALARWRHPEWGVLDPEHFMDAITQSSLSLPFGQWLIEQAGCLARRFRDAGHSIMIGVNLAQDHIETGAFLEALSATRSRHDLQDPFLTIEVMESSHFHDLDLACSLLQEACGLGAEISLDDFGSGISSITYASQLPLSTLKIDRTAIQSVESRPESRQFIKGLIHMAHAMGRKVLAEGIESRSQLKTLKEIGCDLGQGFHIGRPMAMDDLETRYLTAGPTDGDYPLRR